MNALLSKQSRLSIGLLLFLVAASVGFAQAAEQYYYQLKIYHFKTTAQEERIDLHFNAVFYAEVLAGSRMPNLMYMTTFNSKQDRDQHWDTFKQDPEWKSLSTKPEYLHTVSKSDILFLHPADYSDF